MNTTYEVRFAFLPDDVKTYDTQKLRNNFLIENLMKSDVINLVYTHYDRYIAGSAVPVQKSLALETIDELKANYFLERRELPPQL